MSACYQDPPIDGMVHMVLEQPEVEMVEVAQEEVAQEEVGLVVGTAARATTHLVPSIYMK